ncbi:ANTAR domain-containing protein [Streptomyces sp. NPDC018045]|uniref:ANTAR domain-containing protein n=1 Tax=Streptomyces sp. NPDC018045 TaxID=3365037 RepID=UPI003796EF87
MDREQLVTETFIELANTLVDDFDVIAFLQQLCVRCAELLEVRSAAVFLALPGEPLHPVAPCDPGPVLTELLAVAQRDGPALECHRTAAALSPVDLSAGADRWPAFASCAHRAGYRFASALPLRLRHQPLGALLLLRTASAPVPEADVRLAQALADAAALGLVNARTLAEHRTVNTQLRTALHSRIVIEQAKGALKHRLNTTTDLAFETMRRYARHHHRRLTSVAQEVIDEGLLPVVPAPPRLPGQPGQGHEPAAVQHPGETAPSMDASRWSADRAGRSGGANAVS